MTYIEYLNNFHLWLESNKLPTHSKLLYFSLLNVFNRAGWPDYVQVDNRRLLYMADVYSEKTAIQARDSLVNAGIICYQRGKKGNPGKYSLVNLQCNYNSNINTKSNSTIVSVSDSTIASHNKTKTNTKIDNNIYNNNESGVKKILEDKGLGETIDYFLNKINPTAPPFVLDKIKFYYQQMGVDCCKRAFDIALAERKTSWSYINTILQNKLSQGVKCIADWDESDKKHEDGKRAKEIARNPGKATSDDFQPKQETIKKNNDWLDKFLDENDPGWRESNKYGT